MLDKQFLMDFLDILLTNVWKVFPFRGGNRVWLLVIMKAYVACLMACFLLACVLNSVEGDKWLKSNYHDHGVRARGDTALDECIWFVFTSSHGIGFGEFMPRGPTGRIIAMGCVAMGYWFAIFLMCIVMLSQLPGEKTPTLYSVATRMVSSVWPSYAVFCCITIFAGCTVGPYLSRDKDGLNEWPTGVYWTWTVVHRAPYGDIWPNTVYGRYVTVPAAFMSAFYMPYALALIAVRCPTLEQHQALLSNLRSSPEDALGRGYIVPKEDVSMQDYTAES